MAALTLSSLTDLQKVNYVREGLPLAKPKLIYSQYAVKDRVAKREGKTRQWFRMSKIDPESGTSGNFSGYNYEKNQTGAAPTFTPATPGDTTISAQVDFLFDRDMSGMKVLNILHLQTFQKNFAHSIICTQQKRLIQRFETC